MYVQVNRPSMYAYPYEIIRLSIVIIVMCPTEGLKKEAYNFYFDIATKVTISTR